MYIWKVDRSWRSKAQWLALLGRRLNDKEPRSEMKWSRRREMMALVDVFDDSMETDGWEREAFCMLSGSKDEAAPKRNRFQTKQQANRVNQ
jgi:hypothetical protein